MFYECFKFFCKRSPPDIQSSQQDISLNKIPPTVEIAAPPAPDKKPSQTIQEAIENNTPIEEKLHVVSVISNPCNFKKRYKLANEYIKRMENTNDVILYIVELCYGDQPFAVTDSNNPRHLQLRTSCPPIWHKENMINIGVQKLLPKNWRAFAWIDADIEFDSPHWATDTLKILNGTRDIIQLFSHCVDMAADETTMNVYNSFGFQFSKGLPYTYKFPNYWHCGYGFAFTRTSYDQMGGLYDLGILGASDHIMTFCFLGKGLEAVKGRYSEDFKKTIIDYEDRCKGLTLGYTPVVIRHYFHGAKANRKYVERNEILINHQYAPSMHLQRDNNGLYIPTSEFPEGFAQEIMGYFEGRNEDEQ